MKKKQREVWDLRSKKVGENADGWGTIIQMHPQSGTATVVQRIE